MTIRVNNSQGKQVWGLSVSEEEIHTLGPPMRSRGEEVDKSCQYNSSVKKWDISISGM